MPRITMKVVTRFILLIAMALAAFAFIAVEPSNPSLIPALAPTTGHPLSSTAERPGRSPSMDMFPCEEGKPRPTC
jgi:hypothetical protein